MKILCLFLITSSLSASHHTRDKLTITMEHESPIKLPPAPTLSPRPTNPIDRSPEFNQVKVKHHFCTTKIKLALISGGVTITAAGLSALITYYAMGKCE